MKMKRIAHFGILLCLMTFNLNAQTKERIDTTGQKKDSLRINILVENSVLLLEKNEYEKSRDLAEQIIKIDDKYCLGYFLLGMIYSKYAHTKDYFESCLIYCLAIDMFEMAKKADLKCENDANKYIQLYSNYLLDREGIFVNIKEGEEISIDDWVNRKTKFRYKN